MLVDEAIKLIENSKRIVAFTGAGISVESGIPPFRGENGLWSKYDPSFLEIGRFRSNPEGSWKLIKEIFYDFFGKAKPNEAHIGLAEIEGKGFLHTIITQNIDNLHFEGGSKNIYEFHGNSRDLICMNCGQRFPVSKIGFEHLPPRCKNCGGILKPDFVFFGEPIPEPARTKSFEEAHMADVFLLIGTTGEIMPASQIPFLAKSNGVSIIEININPSNYTNSITDIFLEGRATKVVNELVKRLKK